jgi:hypothetical protein
MLKIRSSTILTETVHYVTLHAYSKTVSQKYKPNCPCTANMTKHMKYPIQYMKTSDQARKERKISKNLLLSYGKSRINMLSCRNIK